MARWDPWHSAVPTTAEIAGVSLYTYASVGTLSAAASGSLVGNVTDLVRIQSVCVPLIVQGLSNESTLLGILGLRTRGVRLVPSELSTPTEFRCPPCSHDRLLPGPASLETARYAGCYFKTADLPKDLLLPQTGDARGPGPRTFPERITLGNPCHGIICIQHA